jgi:hypothetical protein
MDTKSYKVSPPHHRQLTNAAYDASHTWLNKHRIMGKHLPKERDIRPLLDSMLPGAAAAFGFRLLHSGRIRQGWHNNAYREPGVKTCLINERMMM